MPRSRFRGEGIILGGVVGSPSILGAGRQAACTAPKNARAVGGTLASVGGAWADTAIAIAAAACLVVRPSGGRGSRPNRRRSMIAATQRRSVTQRRAAAAPTILHGLVPRRTSGSDSLATPNSASAHATAPSV